WKPLYARTRRRACARDLQGCRSPPSGASLPMAQPSKPSSPTAVASTAPVAAASDYSASSIQVLEGLEAVRKRPAMYIGSTDARGLHHLVYEVVDNSIDEALAGFCDSITVVLQTAGACRVAANGRGMPVALPPTCGKPDGDAAAVV